VRNMRYIEDAINRLDGISSVIVNLGAEKAYVTYNPKMTSVADMKKAIEEAGYQYLGVAGDETEDLEEVARERDLREKRSRFNVVRVFNLV
jgi:Cu+-exporting ATPase